MFNSQENKIMKTIFTLLNVKTPDEIASESIQK